MLFARRVQISLSLDKMLLSFCLRLAVTKGTAVTAAASLLLLACSSDGTAHSPTRQAQPSVYVGAVENTDALVAVVHDGVDWAAYVCGGADTYATMTGWFSGPVEQATEGEHLHAPSGNKEFTAAVKGQLATGTVVVDGMSFAFTAPLSGGEDATGLYDVLDEGCRTGLVIPPASLGEPQGVWCSAPGRFAEDAPSVFAQVTPIRPWVTADRIVRVTVSPPALMTRQLSLAPVILPLN